MSANSSLALFKRDADHVATRTTLILLPPFPFDHRMWEAVARRFEGIPVIAVDPPGFGASMLPSETPALELYADLVAESIRAHGVTSAVVCGNGMGGYAAMAMVERHPRLVRGIGLIGTHAAIDEPSVRARRTEMAITAFMGRAQDELVDELPAMVSRETARDHSDVVDMAAGWVRGARDDAIAWAQRAMSIRPGRLEMLQRADVKGVVVRGEQDRYTTASQADQLARAVGESYVVNVPRAGHLIPIEQPGAVARAVLGLYARCLRGNVATRRKDDE
ncbi:alpha/beta hydrolase [Nanchangia anserum]|uniref:Alpha/beta hydrolase n=1 Tax=Nanchangia anserum TaxID=2692125 RepID=A0A8I0G8L8_9ACTO|nr:alpha/beta hydrolase [Nanchangia anserum]MBD3689925.1 alpha/beta hydrolase [Nanchangia anserum]QOX82260.1 alpha/beta hydrolase [Nanchangia anserum]